MPQHTTAIALMALLPGVLLGSPASAAKIYWTGGGAHISRANLDGTGIEYNIMGDGVHGIAIDPVNGHVYWNSTSVHDLLRANLDGTGVEIIIAGAGSGAMALDIVYIPEPAALTLLAFGMLALIGRRRE